MSKRILSVVILFAFCETAQAQTAGMQSFQGRLKQNGTPVPNGPVYLKFEIFDDPSAGVSKAGPFCVQATATNGLVSTKFGPVLPSAFDGTGRWLEVSICQDAPCQTCSALARLEMATAPAAAEQLNRPGTGTGAVFVDSLGHVGIGTSDLSSGVFGTGPSLWLKGCETGLKLESSIDGAGGCTGVNRGGMTIGLFNTDDIRLSLGTDTNIPVSIRTNGGEALRVTGDQKVGINTASPQAYLDVNASAILASSVSIGRNSPGFPGLMNFFNNSGDGTITLDGNASGGGAITMRNASGINVARLRRHPNESGVLDLNRDDGSSGITLEGNGSSGAGGGFIHIRSATTSTNTISLAGNDGTGGGYVSITNGETTNLETIKLDGNNSSGAGELWVRGGSASSGEVELLGDSSGRGGRLLLRNAAGALKIDMYADIGTGQSRIVADCFAGTVGCDIAESFELSERDKVEPGHVLVMDDKRSGHLTLSRRAYDKKVAGIVSGAGGLKPGVVLGGGENRAATMRERSAPERVGSSSPREHAPAIAQGPLADARGSDRTGIPQSPDLPIALSGRVYCYADATTNAVEIGDLLTTSNTPGYAMKVTDFPRSQGAVLGKAMEPMAKGKKGLILVLVALQ